MNAATAAPKIHIANGRRTPKKSFINPWISRMNSSANQNVPINHRRDAFSRTEFRPEIKNLIQ